jgi:hypothetical protein
MLGVLLRGLMSMMGRMQAMCMRDMGMMTCLFMMAGFVVLRSLAMMARRVLVMLGRSLMVAARFVFARALRSPLGRVCQRTSDCYRNLTRV